MGEQIFNKPEFPSHYVTKKPTPVIIQTTDHRLHGDVHVGLGKRLKDELDGGLQFLPVTNVTVYSARDEILYRTHFMLINRDQLVWILPDEDLIDEDDLFGS